LPFQLLLFKVCHAKGVAFSENYLVIIGMGTIGNGKITRQP
jgi:hypothetical protein